MHTKVQLERRSLMNVEQRIRMSLLIEKMVNQKSFCEKLGMENASTFRRKKIHTEGEKNNVDHII